MSVAVTNSACDRAQQALSNSAMWVLRQLKVDQDGKDLVLTGQVSSFYHKQMAQEIVRAAAAGVPLINRIQVQS
ncbi:MAG: BON domain-containing protein [Pirellulales bacterium]